MVKPEKDIEKIVRDVTAIMSFENMDLTEQDKDNMRQVLNGSISADDMVAQIVREYKEGGV